MKYLSALLAVFAVALVTTDSFAWHKVCNKRSSGAWVTYSHWISKETRIDYECGFNKIQGSGCYYSAWKTDGWWYLTPNTCVTVLGGDITNRYSYVHADFDDGRTSGSGFPIYIRDPEFHWDKDEVSHGSNCVVGLGIGECGGPAGYWANYSQVDTGSSKNFTTNLTN